MKKIIFNFLIKILIGILMLIISSHFTEIINILPSIYASSWSLEKYLKYLLPDYYLDDKPLPSLPNEELRRIRNIDMPRATGLNSEMIKSNEVHKFLIKGELVDSLDVENYNKNLELFNRTKYLIKNRYPGLSERSLNKKVEEAIRLYNNDPTWIENLINSNKLWFKNLFDGKLPIFKKIFNNPIGSEELPLIDNRERIFRKAGIRNNELDQIVNPTRNILTQLKDYKKKLRDTGEDSIWRDY